LNTKIYSENSENQNSYTVIIREAIIDLDFSNLSKEESYQVDTNRTHATVSSMTESGFLYGCITLSKLQEYSDPNGWTTPTMKIKDAPRYGYRGLAIDVARNFKSKDEIKKIIKVMGRYKLNKLHLHLTDDEGWRLEMKSREELTRIGSVRKYSKDWNQPEGISPQLGSGVDGIRQFYTEEDYREILVEAESNKVQLIPEFDFPGHANAALKSNLAKYQETGNTSNLIQDLNDTTNAVSVQMFIDNAINPCFEGTFRFIEDIVRDLYELHKGIQDLKVFHLGGDEIANVWTRSPACLQFIDKNIKENFTHLPRSIEELGEYFLKRSGEIINKIDNSIDLGLWEDGAIEDKGPYNKSELFPNDVYTYAWQNVWEWGVSNRAYKLANADYKVVLSQATHLYFDMPYEPDPEERGYYWASRFTDLKKVFSFKPCNIYDNSDYKRSGEVYLKSDMCKDTVCTPLERPENIVGMQAALFSETVRTNEQLEYMIFPRLLSFAERAWHQADWEKTGNETEMELDYTRFINTLNSKEFEYLNAMNVSYRISPPTARFNSQQTLETKCEFKRFSVEYADANLDETDWETVKCGETITTEYRNIKLRTIDTKTGRVSREIIVKNSSPINSSLCLKMSMFVYYFGLILSILIV